MNNVLQLKHNSGYTLIELMITITLVALIALVGIPITGAWVKSADIDQTEDQIIEALGRAKASGIRNVAGKTGNGLVARVCIDTANHSVRVVESTSSDAADCNTTPTGTLLWHAAIDEGITVVNSSSSAVSCMCTNNKGLLVNDGACSSCYTGSALIISAGSKTKTVEVF